MNIKHILFVASILFCLSAKAQNITPPHLKAAENMLTASGADTLFKSNIATVLTATSARIPEDKRATYINVMNRFITKYISWEILKDQLSAIYAQEFSEKELKELTAFYNTPLGKKLTNKLPMLSKKGAKMGQMAVESHQSELQQMMQDAFKGQ